ncbi:MAG: murein biosynthesis integral membrane protein MurJ, partial [Planctomycetota bacterium]|nr:murein biosynthesis integral membrane protein MurJ [Planctomycetota bacterium]
MERKDASFVRSAGLLSFLTLISRVLGLVREGVCAYFFGAGELWGDFSIAFRIPNLSRRLFGEGALSAAFIPVLSERLHQDDRPAAAALVGQVVML